MRGLDGTSVRWFVVLLLLMGVVAGTASGVQASASMDGRVVWAGRVEFLGCLMAVGAAWLVLTGGFGLAFSLLLPSALVPVAIAPSLFSGATGQVYLGAFLVAVALLAMGFTSIAASGSSQAGGASVGIGGPWLGSASVSVAWGGLLGASPMVKALLALGALALGSSLPGVVTAPASSAGWMSVESGRSGSQTSWGGLFGDSLGFGSFLLALLPRAPVATDDASREESTNAMDDSRLQRARPAPAVAPTRPPSRPPALVQADPGATLRARIDVLHAYYRDLNSGDFQAERYFAPSVERFITMQGTTSAAINQYIRGPFPKQFQRHHFEMDDSTPVAEGHDTVVYVEHSRYLLVRKSAELETWVRVRAQFDDTGKIRFFRQFEVIKRQSL